MARPKTDPARVVRMLLQPPREMNATMRALWHAEFDHFPPGYFAPSDRNALTLYLDVVCEYRAAQKRADATPNVRNGEQVRATRHQLMTFQRALRMYPSTRSGVTHGRMVANDSASPQEGVPAWRKIMSESDPAKPN